ncbi:MULTISPECIES: spore photoproduct lyase [Clostridium]|uniref:Spore photoproduct lyase n=1 Tax=Clostridium butyricum TaxID=1492 RepID=A0AAP9REQ9_CLOBU|nr:MULTISPECIES: spore photoproduct lyase [Clostridium]ALP90533.1 spore photoproduct lyase [Clostridium butyricum]ALS17036.1 spore photoproduct lyase [Clostridium butyricum]ANF14152.1 spore photoproduct lyase [Clostridium butyricum]AOR94219.1 spore photoproduct lyase [Clostridium butyricum]MBZ5744664.1 spore photoproduct lyase [Clostridium butyricum]
MFIPKRVIFEKDSLETEVGKNIYNKIKNNPNIEIINASSNKIKSHIPGDNLFEQYKSGKQTLVVGKRKSLKFQTCKPSANYQLPLVSGCMGRCEYCYLNTQLGDKPFVRVFTNIDDVLNRAKEYIEERLPQITIFEGAATSDPIPLEPYTNALKKTIEFIGKEEKGRFRFVTKYNDVDTLLDAKHNNHTEIRFSINTPTVINTYEHYTASIDKRIEAAVKVANAGYKIGFIIAPIFIYDNWQKEYKDLIENIKSKLPSEFNEQIIFEVISHRYTTKAKNRILEIFPETTLPMNDEDRKFKYGQFGYGKYIYTKDQLAEIKEFFIFNIKEIFPNSIIKYVI